MIASPPTQLLQGLDPNQLAPLWKAAEPFPHVVINGALPEVELLRARRGLTREHHFPNQGGLYEFMASGDVPKSEELVRFNAGLNQPDTLAAVSAISGKQISSAHIRSFVYLPGHYLLPHTDFDPKNKRQVAFALYLSESGTVQGGELTLYDVTLHAEEITASRDAKRIEPARGRLVLFDVSRASLHEVREVLSGARTSLAGWFYA